MSQIKTNIRQVLINKAKRHKATWVINSKGHEYYEYNGDKIKPEHLALILPVVVKVIKDY